jgi:hypothetical protein
VLCCVLFISVSRHRVCTLSSAMYNITNHTILYLILCINVQVKGIRSIFPTHTSERRKRLQAVCHAIRRNDGSVTKCRLSSEYIDDAMISMLCNALPNNTKLLSLQLHNNRITDTGVLTLSRSLKRHPNFNTLWIGGNRITDQGMLTSDVIEL